MEPFDPYYYKVIPDRQRYAFFEYKTAFLAIQFICDRHIQCGTKHVGNSVVDMCKEHCRDPSHLTLGIIQDPIAQNAFDTRSTTLLMAFLIPQAYLQSLNSRTLSLFTTAAQNLHQWSECHAMYFILDDVWTNPVNDAMRGSRGGGKGPDPSPLENHKFYRFI